MYAKFQPINDGVLVKLIEKQSTTKSGIIIPKDAQEKVQEGQVVHAGKSAQIKKGDNIFFKKYLGHPLDENYIVLREEDILGVL